MRKARLARIKSLPKVSSSLVRSEHPEVLMAKVLNARQLRKMGVSQRTGSELAEVVGSFLSGYVHLTIPFKSGEKQMRSLPI